MKKFRIPRKKKKEFKKASLKYSASKCARLNLDKSLDRFKKFVDSYYENHYLMFNSIEKIR